MPFTAQQQKEHREKLKKMGICTRCHRRKPEEGKTRCKVCREYLNEWRRKIRAKGDHCHRCHQPLEEWDALMGVSQCEPCAEWARVDQRRRKIKRRINEKITV